MFKLIWKIGLRRYTLIDFKLPDLGEKIKEATIKKWHIKEGDEI